jgi:polysaccharide pyruvyl transferase WcaK-like protein
MELAKRMGCVCPTMEFGPDGAFAVDLEDTASAKEFARSNELDEEGFVCCIPRLRFTPYWTIPEKKIAKDENKHARNEAMKEQDCKPLRDAILTVLENSKLKVLLCPEDRTQMAVAKEMIYDALPQSAKSRVVWRQQYWLTDEAISTYRMSAGLFGHEMHSPIMCIGNGIPAIVCRWAEQTSKGLMWRDIGLDGWLFDFDQESERRKLAPAVLSMISDPVAAKNQVLRAQKIVTDRQKATMQILKKSLMV